MSKRSSFLNAKRTIDLPSNLLNVKKEQHELRGESMPLKPTRMLDSTNRYLKTIDAPTYVGEKGAIKDKQVLYKRLSNIRGENKEIGNLSFSKMLSRMVVLDEDEVQDNYNNAFEQRLRQTLHAIPIPQKLYDMKCNKNASTRAPSRSIDLDDVKKPSRKLFKKFYLPSSEVTQNFYLETGNPADKYIYHEGRKVECKRIHNFYTSHMFRNGYDKCFRKTTSSFKESI